MIQKIISICCCIAGILCMYVPSIDAESRRVNDIREMRDVVVKNNLEVFLQTATNNKWRVPAIYSQWHIENVAEKSTVSEKKTAREFGADLVKRISVWAEDMHSASTSSDNFKESYLFLQLAHWASGSSGYGNSFIAARCQDIAKIGIGRLLLDLEYPIESINGLLGKLEQNWNMPSFRAKVLNQESGAEIFVFKTNDEKEIKIMLDEIWRYGEALVLREEAFSGSFPMNLLESIKEAVNEVKNFGQYIFWRNETRVKGYRSAYGKRTRSKVRSDSEETSETPAAAVTSIRVYPGAPWFCHNTLAVPLGLQA